jgi:hypothetical protein
VSEIWLPVGPTQGAVKVVLRRVNVRRGVGVARFMFTLEVSTKQLAAVGCSFWLGGRVELLEQQGRARPFLATPLCQAAMRHPPLSNH